jgi:hypothetical protein
MKKTLATGLIIAMAILGLMKFFAWKQEKALETKTRLLQNSMDEIAAYNRELIRIYQVLPQDIQSRFPRLDSILKTQNIKPSQVSNVTQIHNHYTQTDTTIMILDPIGEDSAIFSYGDTLGCFTFNGLVDFATRDVKIFDVQRDETIYLIDYAERKNLFGLPWSPAWGRWQQYRQTKSTCTGELTTTRIQVIKKRKKR